MKRPAGTVALIMMALCCFGLPAFAQLQPGDTVLQQPPVPEAATLAQDTPETSMPVREQKTPPAQKSEADRQPGKERIQVQGQDADTGLTINIDISSNDLTYQEETGVYTVTGDVYIIVPEKSLEILADEATFDPATSTMIVSGHVFIMSETKVLGSQQAQFDLKNNVSYFIYPKTVSEDWRMSGTHGERSETYVVMRNGRFIVDPKLVLKSPRYSQRGLTFGSAAFYSYLSATHKDLLLRGNTATLFTEGRTGGTLLEMEDEFAQTAGQLPRIPKKPISPRDVMNADFSTQKGIFRFKAHKINVYRKENGFDKVVLRHNILRYKNLPFLYWPSTEFGFDENTNYVAYLGQDFGYREDYGGLFFGPGFDIQMLGGWLRFSPIVTYGGGLTLETSPKEVSSRPGVGLAASFLSKNTRGEFGYGSTMQEPIFLLEHRLFGGRQNRIRFGYNHFYMNGFFGQERPRYIAEITDFRQFQVAPRWALRTFASLDLAKDIFLPTRQRRFFVDPKSLEPVETVRAQIQGQLITTQPLLYLGKYGTVGALAQGRLAAYGTGDVYGVFQGGPYVNLVLGPTYTQVNYSYSATAGSSPFVFDTFYQGRSNLFTVNAIDLGRYLTVGATHSLSLSRDNARNAVLLNQRFFASFGPKNLRFSIAYDTTLKRTLFGITLNPSGGNLILDFNSLNIYEPNYDARIQSPTAFVRPRKDKTTKESRKLPPRLPALDGTKLQSLQ